jgi:hypothetical protein
VVALVAPMLAADVQADLTRLEETGDLDVIQPRRAEVIEQWQARARRSPSRVYSVATASGERPLRVANTSQFHHGSENAWVSVERYLTGKVVDLGGKQNPNVHLVMTETGKSLRIDATEEQLGGEKENQLYKVVALRVQAEQHLRSKELRNIRLIKFLPQWGEADEGALANLWQKGREAWREVTSATGWVESMRGSR